MTDSIDVKALRLRLGWSQVRMAERLGVSPSVVSRIESGQKPHGSTLKILQELAAQPRAQVPTEPAPPADTFDDPLGR